MKSALIAAVVSALVASTGTYAATQINGHSIQPHSIPLNRLTNIPAGPQGPVGPAGPQGPAGIDPLAGLNVGVAYLCVGNYTTATKAPDPSCGLGEHLAKVVVVN